MLSPEERGLLFMEMADDFLAGRYENVAALPMVVGMKVYASPRPKIPPHLREDVLTGALCAACGGPEWLEVDHVHPWSKGGSNDRDNLQALCKPCNMDKGAKTMQEWQAWPRDE